MVSPVIKLTFEQFIKNPVPSLEKISREPANSDPSVVWEALLGNPAGSSPARGGTFLMRWTDLDQDALKEIRALLGNALAFLKPETSQRYPQEIARLHKLATIEGQVSGAI